MISLMDYFNYACVYFVIAFFIKILWSKRRGIRITLKTLKRDVDLIYIGLVKNLADWIWKYLRNETVFKSLDKNCKTEEDRARTCFLYEEEKWSFGEVQRMSFQVANYFQRLGYKKGDVVGLAMQNRPEVICIWLGLSRLGVITALINFNIRGDSLEHCITSAKCKSVIFGSELKEAMKEIWHSREQREEPQVDLVWYEMDSYLNDLRHPPTTSSPPSRTLSSASLHNEFAPLNLSEILKATSSSPVKLREGEEAPKFYDTFIYIFTSGTTGMPKPAKCVHGRQHFFGSSFYFLGLTKRDVAYCPLPLYHTFASSGVIWALSYGVPLVIIPKFSASKFWSDVHYYKVTVSLYMGELLRFIVNQPEQPELERNHSLRVMYGCGVKAEVWSEFIKRFEIKRFVECYGSTEGNCTLINIEGTKVGAVGYVPVWIQWFYSTTLIRIDEVTGEILRDKETGLALESKPGEAGELVARIVNYFPSLRYDGYTSKEANEKKLARDVFRKGDEYFRSGDIMTKDEEGYFFFKDRIGDTFRWKGENVSTAEVEGLILKLTGMKTTVVYGVKVPGTEGSAGMAVIVDQDGTLDLKMLAEGLEKGLPSYARPVFLRVTQGDNGVSMTGTFKLPKFNLQRDGFNVERVPDPVFIYKKEEKMFVKLDLDTYKMIMMGSYRF